MPKCTCSRSSRAELSMVSKAADISNSVRESSNFAIVHVAYYVIVNFEKGCFGGMKTFISRLYMVR